MALLSSESVNQRRCPSAGIGRKVFLCPMQAGDENNARLVHLQEADGSAEREHQSVHCIGGRISAAGDERGFFPGEVESADQERIEPVQRRLDLPRPRIPVERRSQNKPVSFQDGFCDGREIVIEHTSASGDTSACIAVPASAYLERGCVKTDDFISFRFRCLLERIRHAFGCAFAGTSRDDHDFLHR